MEHMSAGEYRNYLKAPSNKYHARAATVAGTRFASTGEADRWTELTWLEKSGEIRDLKRQQKLRLTARITWRIDFAYIESGRQIYEDFKGTKTQEYQVKKRLLCDLIDAGTIKAVFRESSKAGIWEYGGAK